MAWYEIINAKSDNFVADRDAEELVRHFAAVLHGVEPPGDAEIFYGRTTNSARRYYVSLSPEAVELAERVLASYDATESATSGKAGGLKKVEPLKAVDVVNRSKRFGCEPPTGGPAYHRSI